MDIHKLRSIASFIGQIARMKIDGELYDSEGNLVDPSEHSRHVIDSIEPYVMENDDAVSTLCSLIREARVFHIEVPDFTGDFNPHKGFEDEFEAVKLCLAEPDPVAALIATVESCILDGEKDFAANVILNFPENPHATVKPVDEPTATPPMEEPKDGSRLIVAAFDFDDTDPIVGWTEGRTWNGWGKPIVEANSFRRWLEHTNRTAGFGNPIFTIHPDQSVSYAYDPDEGENEDMPPAPLMRIRFADGRIEECYNLGDLGLTWNQFRFHDDPGDVPDEWMDAIHRKGFFPDNLAHLRKPTPSEA